jgi:hypothetical protein
LTAGVSGPQWPAASTRARGAGGTRREAERLARTAFALLVLACFGALFLTQRLKHTPTAVQRFQLTPRFSPTPVGHIKQERISFKLSKADEVTVTIVDAAGDTVATLVRDQPLVRYRQFSLRWNGNEGTAHGQTLLRNPDGTAIVVPVNDGKPAPEGEYRVRVSLRRQHRVVFSPSSFTLVG